MSQIHAEDAPLRDLLCWDRYLRLVNDQYFYMFTQL